MDELKWEPILNASEIGVAVKDGVVTLSGNVNTYNKRISAENAAKRVRDVKAVAMDIEVRLSPLSKRNDAEIATAVVDSLKWNNVVPDEKIKVTVDGGHVTMEGEVDWQYQKDAANNAIKYITGVTGITNFIRIKPRINTVLVKDNIKKALERNADVVADKIDVETLGHTVTLKGKARSWNERIIAERAAWSSPGVLDVKDELVIA